MSIIILNNGPDIVSTNYWQTKNATNGLLYLSASEKCLRLLVPKALEKIIPAMQDALHVSVEHSTFGGHGAYDIVFHDGTAEPFVITMALASVDWRSLLWGADVFAVWTEQGRQLYCDCFFNL